MTKKGLVFIIFLVSVLSILIIAVWGTLPENTNRVSLETLEIIDYDEINEEGEKLKEIKDIVTLNNPVYLLEYSYGPDDAYLDFKISVSKQSINVVHDVLNKLVYLYYSLNDIEKEVTITVTIKDQRTQKEDTITLWFSIPDIIIVPE